MTCTEVRPLFSSYLDRVVSGAEMHQVAGHLGECATCQQEYTGLETTRAMVAALGRKQAPAELPLKLRVAIASERSHTWRRMAQSLAVRLENACNLFALPATAGVITAVIFFAALIGFFVPVPATADDVPTMLYIPPRLEMSGDLDMDLTLDSPVVVEVMVDTGGMVANYRIISGRDDDEVRVQLTRALLRTKFAPAQSFGQPVPGRAVISFAQIKVRG
ncbi:MAG TPA: zf-HC2 domain-containing protein [Candidatus Angelobacter sp.]